jgi:hypothetical protein
LDECGLDADLVPLACDDNDPIFDTFGGREYSCLELLVIASELPGSGDAAGGAIGEDSPEVVDGDEAADHGEYGDDSSSWTDE